jgi:hypothetical protein
MTKGEQGEGRRKSAQTDGLFCAKYSLDMLSSSFSFNQTVQNLSGNIFELCVCICVCAYAWKCMGACVCAYVCFL